MGLDRSVLLKKYGKNSAEMIEFFIRHLEFVEDAFNNKLSTLNVVAAESVGTAESGVTAVETGSASYHKTELTMDFALPAIAGGANLAVGKKLYTFPNANIRILTAAFIGVAITQTDENITADTPDVGLGTTIASGEVATLNGTPAFENVLTGQTFTDCDGTEETAAAASTLVIASGETATALYFNVADEWAADGDEAAAVTGKVVVTWEYLD